MNILKLLVLFPWLIICSNGKSLVIEKCKAGYDSLTGKKVYDFVDEMPEFPEGTNGLIKCLNTHMKPSKNEVFQGSFQVEFIIDDRGNLIGPRIKNKKISEINKNESQILKAFNELPKWRPGKCNGKYVAVRIFLPLKL
jgi:hypothetical protein